MSAQPAADTGRTFFRSRWVRPPAEAEELDPAELAPGFRAGVAACGLKGGGATDVGLLACDTEPVSALLLTANALAAAPVRVCRGECDAGRIRAAVVNAGNANAATGERGYRDALAMRDAAAEATGVAAPSVAVAETGVIGVPLATADVVRGIGDAAAALSERGGAEFARAIMTTDSRPKACTVCVDGITLSAQAKGAGMIEPGFATLLCFVPLARKTLASLPGSREPSRAATPKISAGERVMARRAAAAGRP